MRAGRSRRIESIVDAVGNTPLVRLRGIARELAGVQIWAKLEFANPGGSVKDRPALSDDAGRVGGWKAHARQRS